MKHASSRELFAYWTARRGARPAPDRGEIEPSAIRQALGDVFILAFDRRANHPFRLAGTRVCALFGRELRNESFLDVWDAGSRAALIDLMAVVGEENTGVVAGANGRTVEGWSQEMELLVLPLRHGGEAHARVIGVLAPLSVPFWLGASRLDRLTLGTIRHLDPAFETSVVPRLIAGVPADAPAERPRGIFVVHEGGRR